jgi:hypothetical protein
MAELLGLLFFAALVWFWADSMKAREAALRAARRACEADGLQLLDDTVAIAKRKLARDDDGVLRLERAYRFEYTDTGDNRRVGGVTLLGAQVTMLYVGPTLVPADSTPPTLH